MIDARVLFVGDSEVWSQLALALLVPHFGNVAAVLFDRGDAHPRQIQEWTGEWILSFKSDLVLSNSVLKSASKAAINFHPAPPRYRGIGGYEWALEHRDSSFGTTCHHMVDRLDFGDIIDVTEFPILETDTPSSLRQRSAVYCLAQFVMVVGLIASQRSLPKALGTWGTRLHTYADLEQLRLMQRSNPTKVTTSSSTVVHANREVQKAVR